MMPLPERSGATNRESDEGMTTNSTTTIETETGHRLTTTTTRRFRRGTMALLMLLGTVVGTGAFIGSTPDRSEAWATSGNVTLQGRAIACSGAATWVWVEGSNGERGWATQAGGNYRFNFRNVPTRTMTVRVNFGRPGCSRTTTFGLNRPSVGTSATRNVVSIY